MFQPTTDRLLPFVLTAIFLLLTQPAFAQETETASAEPNAYHGFPEIRGEQTGWFHLEKFGNRDLLVTPDGHAFVAFGINHSSSINSQADNETPLFKDRYQSDWKNVQADLFRQYKDWGMNTLDKTPDDLRGAMPYTFEISIARTAKYFTAPDGENPYDFPDVFDPKVQMELIRKVFMGCVPRREDRSLIGFHWTDTPTWDIQKTRQFRGTDWVSEIRKLGPDSRGKQRYIDFLEETYNGDLQQLQRAYGISANTYDDLLESDYKDLDLTRYEVARDDEVFLGIIAQEYYRIIGRSTREAAPNHLILGEKYLLGDLPPQVLAAALPYVDVISIQPGDGYLPIYTPGDLFPAAELRQIYEQAQKPIFICDHQIAFTSERYPKVIWPYHQRDNEADAAAATKAFILDAFQNPYIIGYMRCQYIDRFDSRRQALKQGIIAEDGTPHALMVEATQDAIARVKTLIEQEVSQ